MPKAFAFIVALSFFAVAHAQSNSTTATSAVKVSRDGTQLPSFGNCTCDLTKDSCDLFCCCDASCSAANKAEFAGQCREKVPSSVLPLCLSSNTFVKINANTLKDSPLCIERSNSPLLGEFHPPPPSTFSASDVASGNRCLPFLLLTCASYLPQPCLPSARRYPALLLLPPYLSPTLPANFSLPPFRPPLVSSPTPAAASSRSSSAHPMAPARQDPSRSLPISRPQRAISAPPQVRNARVTRPSARFVTHCAGGTTCSNAAAFRCIVTLSEAKPQTSNTCLQRHRHRLSRAPHRVQIQCPLY